MTYSEALDPELNDAQLASALVRNAGKMALIMRAEGLESEQKTSVSDVVSAADRAAEKYVMEQLLATRPHDGVIGEEGARRYGTSGKTWVIDPVDGTYNFLSDLTYWCSAIALMKGDIGPDDPDPVDPDVLLGAVYQPQEEKLWLGGEGIPATLNGIAVPSPSTEPLSQLSASTYLHPSAFKRPETYTKWAAAVSELATIRVMGSGSCDLARVSQGQLNCWFQQNTALWDWLPGKALVTAAGGETRVLTSGKSRWFIAGGSTAVAQLSEVLA